MILKVTKKNFLLLALSVVLPCGLAFAQEEEAEESLVNTNYLLKRHRQNLTFAASSSWKGWEVKQAFDCDKATSWFSESGDSAAQESKPWLEVAFPEPVTVVHINVWGNRDPSYPTDYFVTRGRLVLYDDDGHELAAVDSAGQGEHYDFEFSFDKAVSGVKRVRFHSLSDQGNDNPGKCIALGELEIE